MIRRKGWCDHLKLYLKRESDTGVHVILPFTLPVGLSNCDSNSKASLLFSKCIYWICLDRGKFLKFYFFHFFSTATYLNFIAVFFSDLFLWTLTYFIHFKLIIFFSPFLLFSTKLVCVKILYVIRHCICNLYLI